MDPAMLRAARRLKAFSRRAFLGGAVGSALLATDMFVTREVQSRRRQTVVLEMADDAARRRFPDASWVLFPGYKTSWEEGRIILAALHDSLSERGQLAAIGYSNLGLDIDEILDALRVYVRQRRLRTLYFYGHSFGGMVAVEVASRLLAENGPLVEVIVLDSTPASKYDVLDQSWFDSVVFLYDLGIRIPSLVRGGYEFGERVIHKNERTWTQILDQTLEQLSPLAPSSVLIQAESQYIYDWDVTRFVGTLDRAEMAFIGNPGDQTVNYSSARARWARYFPENLVSSDLQTIGAFPAHASPEWSGIVYNNLLGRLLPQLLPLPRKVGGAGGAGR
ncbi:alpha/beta fold hydrolase [Sinomonas sp. ASV486]|uniref:Thioesterase domain-containing protein n=1 Tax=Sinomonas puerhi TaxID=3238584 RepID=A0AB39L441_9MICC|nr:thioesterase domain-containing protein [Sinomonas sp. ASV486]MDQ4490124.1 alpha/beta fold hydrolase [Sinomonas sp. ASV486]